MTLWRRSRALGMTQSAGKTACPRWSADPSGDSPTGQSRMRQAQHGEQRADEDAVHAHRDLHRFPLSVSVKVLKSHSITSLRGVCRGFTNIRQDTN
jgi:hypothetical protein